MTSYLHYWRPERFQRAFPGAQNTLRELASATYSRVAAGDLIWLLTRGVNDLPILAGKFEVRAKPRRCAVPRYAYGNSKWRDHYAVRVPSDSPLKAVPLAWSDMKRLRFEYARNRISSTGMRAYDGELASLRRLTDTSTQLLAEWWLRPGATASDSTLAAAFGDPETNRKVERAAVAAVTRRYERGGWKVESVERLGIGYDLRCTRQKQIERVEVKGRSGDSEHFIMTRGECRQATIGDDYVLCVVSNALRLPAIRIFTATDLRRVFDFEPPAYVLHPKRRRA